MLMFSMVVMTCLLFQTAVAIYLLHIRRMGEDFDRNLLKFLWVLLAHLCTKGCFLLALPLDAFAGRVVTGFGLSYGPLLWICARAYQGRPLSRRAVYRQLAPFALLFLGYAALVAISQAKLLSFGWLETYSECAQWAVVGSMTAYSLATIRFLRSEDIPGGANAHMQRRLLLQIASFLLGAVILGTFSQAVHPQAFQAISIPGFDLRVLPYVCFMPIPVLLLQYQFQKRTAMAISAALSAPDLPPSAPDSPGPQPSSAHSDELPPEPGRNLANRVTHSEPEPERRYQKSALDQEMLLSYEKKVIHYMEKSRVYLEPELSLEDLAMHLHMPKHHLTQLLNDRFQKNFYTFISEYRIQAAVRKLQRADPDENILSLAHDCGFHSKSSFNAYFKKLTGYTPTAYRKLHAGRLETVAS